MRGGKAWCGFLCALGGALSIVVACSGGEGTAGATAPDGAPLAPPGTPGALPPAAPIPREQLESEVAKLACESIESCCQLVGLVYVAGACESRLAASDAGTVQLFPSPPPGDPVTYDPQAAGDCLQWYREGVRSIARACGEPVIEKRADQSQVAYRRELSLQVAKGVPGGDLGIAACNRIFRGTKKPGETCTGEWECEANDPNAVLISRSCRPKDSGSDANVCEVTVFVREGDACNPDETSSERFGCGPPANVALDALTADDLFYCAPDTRTCKRRQRVANGQSCADKAVFCAPLDSYCRDSDRTCQPLQADGAPCGRDDECFSDRCDSASRKCTARKPIGETCEERDECTTARCSTSAKKCIPFPAQVATPASCSGAAG